jgi:putative transposase
MTDAEWALIARRLPPRRRLGRPREVDLRTVLQAILYILSTGCQWRALPVAENRHGAGSASPPETRA